jgi:uncharacterized membrane protein YbaN (DUF454 family)
MVPTQELETRAPDAPRTEVPPPDTRGSGRRLALRVVGFVATVLALFGALAPFVPTTPFVLLAAACFSRSSPRMHEWLLTNRAFGPYLAQWQRDHTIPRDAKRRAYLLLTVSFAFSIALAGSLWPRVALGVIGLALLVLVWWLPTTGRDANRGTN